MKQRRTIIGDFGILFHSYLRILSEFLHFGNNLDFQIAIAKVLYTDEKNVSLLLNYNQFIKRYHDYDDDDMSSLHEEISLLSSKVMIKSLTLLQLLKLPKGWILQSWIDEIPIYHSQRIAYLCEKPQQKITKLLTMHYQFIYDFTLAMINAFVKFGNQTLSNDNMHCVYSYIDKFLNFKICADSTICNILDLLCVCL